MKTLRAPESDDAGEPAEVALWARMLENPSAKAREALFNYYLSFAQALAARHFRDRRSGDIDFQDLRQLACAGLLEAIDRFSPDRGVPFRGYASRRITGSILDGVAKMSEMREQIAFRNRTTAERLRSFSEAGVENLEIAEAMKALGEMAVSLAIGFMLEGTGMAAVENTPDERTNAYESIAWRQTLRDVLSHLNALPEREGALVRKHYLEGVSFEQLADLFGVSRGRISQLHRSAIEHLRSRLTKADGFILER